MIVSGIHSGIGDQRKLIFNGNSHFNLAQNDINIPYNYYVPRSIHANVIAAGYKTPMTAFAVGGNPTTTMNANFDSQNGPLIKTGDVVVLWEITNDLAVNELSGADAYAQVVIFANKVRALGGYILVGTTTARNHVNDPPDIWDRGQACNTLIRDNSGLFDGICDLASDTHFDDEADCDNTTYYIDKLHFATAGQAIIISMWTTTINSFLATL